MRSWKSKKKAVGGKNEQQYPSEDVRNKSTATRTKPRRKQRRSDREEKERRDGT